MSKRLNHLAIAVPDLEKATAFYRDILGAEVSQPVDLPDHGVTTVFVALENTKIELLHPLGKESPISKFLENNPHGGIHHFSLEVKDLEKNRDHLVTSDIRILKDAQGTEVKIGAHGVPVLFLHPKDCQGCLIELEEHK